MAQFDHMLLGYNHSPIAEFNNDTVPHLHNHVGNYRNVDRLGLPDRMTFVFEGDYCSLNTYYLVSTYGSRLVRLDDGR